MDVGDIKKILKTLKDQPLEGKIVDATDKIAKRETANYQDAWARRDKKAMNAAAERSDAAWALRRDLAVPANTNEVETAAERMRKPVVAKEVVQQFVQKNAGVLSESQPVRVAHPLNPKEVFQFPPGTDERNAKEMVRLLLLKRAREGEEKIDLPSNLPGEEPPVK